MMYTSRLYKYLLVSATITVAAAYDPSDAVHKDVLIVGGGASGAYAAVRLREDFGKSIVLIEKESILVSPHRDERSFHSNNNNMVNCLGWSCGLLRRPRH